MQDPAQKSLIEEYGKELPLQSFALLTFLYIGFLTGFFWFAPQQGFTLPDRISLLDMALLAVATHKIAWLVTKDLVLSFLRAPFTRFEKLVEPGAATKEVSRGSGMQKALGELLTCPWCIGQWVATGFVLGFLISPDTTRILAILFAVLMMSDFLHILFIRAGSWMGK